MDCKNELLLVKTKGSYNYQDKTEQVTECSLIDGKYQITYKAGKTYFYGRNNVLHLKNPQKIDIENFILYINNTPEKNVVEAYDFDGFIKVFYSNKTPESYAKNLVSFEGSCLNKPDAKACFEYFKKIAGLNQIREKDIEKSFLGREYDRIEKVNENSVLGLYMMQKTLPKKQSNNTPIFPFGFNLSQKIATENAMNETISIIEGPPGTGKTQTILNIIANAIVTGKTVAVVSNNNLATVNIQEKLKKYGLDFFTAFLGNKNNIEKFAAEQTGKYPDMSSWEVAIKEQNKLKTATSVLQKRLDSMLLMQNKSAMLKQELSELLTEQKYFDDYYRTRSSKNTDRILLYKPSPDRIMSFIVKYQFLLENNKPLNMLTKLKFLILYGIYNLWKYNPEDVVLNLQMLYYDSKKSLLENEIETIKNTLQRNNFEQIMQEYTDVSMKLFKTELCKKYGKNTERTIFQKGDNKRKFTEFVKEYPIILSTTHSLRYCTDEDYMFDYVIIDEASQVDLVTGSLALLSAKKAVIVGDLKQLPNVITQELRESAQKIFESTNLPVAYNYSEHSILSSISSLYANIPKTLLREHYRCHPKIIGFCNQKFYNNELIVFTEENPDDLPLSIYRTVEGNHARRVATEDNKGVYNSREIEVIFNEVLKKGEQDANLSNVGIVSPYRMQADKINDMKGQNIAVEADTVHKYQGREKDTIIMTTVVNELNSFVDDANLVNVAISRAIKKIIVVSSKNISKQHGTNIGDFIRYIEYNARSEEIVNSNIVSVFDILYSKYSEKLLAEIKKIKKVSENKSENLMNMVIERVLSDPQYNSLKCVLHIPLRMLIKEIDILTVEEREFVTNVMTHTDFVIFSKFDKRPILVVEVDGFAFHENNPKQLKRDNMKDGILQKYNIPILRIRTNDSGEEAKLRQKLDKIINISEKTDAERLCQKEI